MTTTVVAPVAPAETTRGAEVHTPRRRVAAWLGLVPFGAYVVLFLGFPAALAVASGFFDGAGAFTFANFAAYTDPTILQNFFASLWISALTAVLGAVFGAIICFALLGTRSDRMLRSTVDSASSVLAQFGGVMLAFAFIATIGVQGVLTKWLVSIGLTPNIFTNFNGNGPLLYQIPGLVIPYLYFQIPLMVLTFMPADGGAEVDVGRGERHPRRHAAHVLGAYRRSHSRSGVLRQPHSAVRQRLLVIRHGGCADLAGRHHSAGHQAATDQRDDRWRPRMLQVCWRSGWSW